MELLRRRLHAIFLRISFLSYIEPQYETYITGSISVTGRPSLPGGGGCESSIALAWIRNARSYNKWVILGRLGTKNAWKVFPATASAH